MCYDIFTRCASYFEVFYYSYMNSFYGKMEVDFMAQWQPSTFTPDKTADTAAYAASLSASATSQSLNRTFLSNLFEQIFNFPSEALSLYNAINGTNYSDPGLLTITTLSGALFLGYRNDLLSEICCIPDDIRERITSETHLDTLKQWSRNAARCQNLEEFIARM